MSLIKIIATLGLYFNSNPPEIILIFSSYIMSFLSFILSYYFPNNFNFQASDGIPVDLLVSAPEGLTLSRTASVPLRNVDGSGANHNLIHDFMSYETHPIELQILAIPMVF